MDLNSRDWGGLGAVEVVGGVNSGDGKENRSRRFVRKGGRMWANNLPSHLPGKNHHAEAEW